MNFNEYQTEAHKTAIYSYDITFPVYEDLGNYEVSKNNVPVYPFLKVNTESAELAEKLIKIIFRKDKAFITQEQIEKDPF